MQQITEAQQLHIYQLMFSNPLCKELAHKFRVHDELLHSLFQDGCIVCSQDFLKIDIERKEKLSFKLYKSPCRRGLVF